MLIGVWYQIIMYGIQLINLSFCFQSTAYASDTGVLSEAMIDSCVDDAIRSHAKKVTWQQEQESGKDIDNYTSVKNASTYLSPEKH